MLAKCQNHSNGAKLELKIPSERTLTHSNRLYGSTYVTLSVFLSISSPSLCLLASAAEPKRLYGFPFQLNSLCDLLLTRLVPSRECRIVIPYISVKKKLIFLCIYIYIWSLKKSAPECN